MKKKKSWVKKRHVFIKKALHFFFHLPMKLKYRYSYEKFKIKKGEKYIVVCNHTTTLDPIFLNLAFNKMLYFVGSDDLFNIKYLSWWLQYLTGIIPKSKGKSDIGTVKTMLRVLKEGGTVAVFPEGNRTYSGELCYISPAITKFFMMSKVPIVIYNIEGGYGVDPRWGLKKRKGKLCGKVKRILSPDEYKTLTEEELHNLIINELNVKNAPSENPYKSKINAECIERVLFRCPECGMVNTITSCGSNFSCSNCNSKWEYTESLTIKKDGVLYKHPVINDWYKEQIEYIKSFDTTIESVIFEDNNLEIYSFTSGKNKTLLGTGSLKLFNSHLEFETDTNKYIYNIDEIDGVSVAGKSGVLFRFEDKAFRIRDNQEQRNNFNSLKYVLMINHIKNRKKGENDEFLGI